MKNVFLLFTLIIFTIGCYKSVEEVNKVTSDTDPKTELRSCWWCISEDVLGMLEGGGIGFAVGGGPMGAAVGGAVVGAYRSIKEYNAQPFITKGDSIAYLSYLADKYTVDRTSNSANNIGIIHNELLHQLVLNRSTLNDTEDYYNFMEAQLLAEFPDFNFSAAFKSSIVSAMETINIGGFVTLSDEHQLLYNTLENSFRSQNEVELLNLINQYETSFENDQIALQGLATAYHTWYFWKNLD